ncbi:hypothetical protein D9758_001745 [Tetrapyrgos nigripes]|uniref:Tetraspanin n=1 Tax=Tetrapyrgos nigripes TaxID=182062 RepID=A0A8H5GXJ5_9AGAR|nr:hypothetical protein D9758_001745 [Tetrapyrgos nigripes]
MVSKGLMAFWGVVDFCLLAAGAISVAFSIIWRKSDVLMNMTIHKSDLTAGLVLGITLLVTFAVSIFAIVQRNHVTIGLVVLNYALIVDAIIVLALGTRVWFFTLRERNNFHERYILQSDENIKFIQDKFSCCGYFNGSDHVVPSNFCSTVQTAFINTLDPTDINNGANFCMYGFMAIVLVLLLATLCVINKRKEEERFKKIDAKRGGKGFV